MVSPPVKFQLKGKRHIAYMANWATSLWVRYDYKIKWETCLLEAFGKHKEYLKTGKHSDLGDDKT